MKCIKDFVIKFLRLVFIALEFMWLFFSLNLGRWLLGIMIVVYYCLVVFEEVGDKLGLLGKLEGLGF